MRTEEQISMQLLQAATVSVFSVILILITMAMSWEMWMTPLIVIGSVSIWCLHIGRTCSGTFYDYLCAGLLLVEFFFFGIHGGQSLRSTGRGLHYGPDVFHAG